MTRQTNEVSKVTAYEFLTQVTDGEAVIIPHEYARKLHKGSSLRVILLVDQPVQIDQTVYETTQGTFNDLPALEELVTEIRRMGANPNNITPASGLLGQHLRELADMPEPEFDVAEWMQEWDRVEAKMKAASLAHEEAERQEWVQ